MNLREFSIGKIVVILAIGISTEFTYTNPVAAQVKVVEDRVARTKTTAAYVNKGESTLIGFENDEIITFVLLSDQSRNIFTPDAPIDSGQARSIVLRQIEKLEIPGTTTTKTPNLFVQTVNAQGETNRYQFHIFNDSQEVDQKQIAIRPARPKLKAVPQPKDDIQTFLGEATPENILLGLETSLKKGKLQPDDPLVFKIGEYVGLTMNGSSANEAIEKLNIPLSILQKVGVVGQKEDARRRLLPLSPNINEEIPQT